nr:MAG TPA: hypothetical protein [Bacteriophage sp.]DAJ60548.1 MAG TPA: hypothetical protein [Caudoviricetes sp.]DAO32107.1 MAG TPA: hypothetical protein [Caudoviricetes sp.]
MIYSKKIKTKLYITSFSKREIKIIDIESLIFNHYKIKCINKFNV